MAVPSANDSSMAGSRQQVSQATASLINAANRSAQAIRESFARKNYIAKVALGTGKTLTP